MIIAITIFLSTLILILWQPKGLKAGTIAMGGAILAMLFGVVDINDIKRVFDITWDATLAFIGIIILSLVLDEIGFFEWAAIKMVKLSKGDGVAMFIYSLLLGSFVSALFANDGAVLILTPILLAKMKIIKLDTKTLLAFLLAGGFISDSASLPFVFSNLTNILTANYFDIGFKTYMLHMALPFIVSTTISIAVLYLYFRKEIPKKIDISLLPSENSIIRYKGLFKFSWLFLILLFSSYFISESYHLPISLFALGGAMLFLFISSISSDIKAYSIIKKTPWQIVLFSIGLYIVVYGLKNVGLSDELAEFFRYLSRFPNVVAVVGTGFVSAFTSAFMNNLPTIMIINISLKHIGNDAMIYANIIGSNIGPKMTPFGSLATLLWLHSLETKGVKINLWDYTKFGVAVTLPVLLVVLLSLCLT